MLPSSFPALHFLFVPEEDDPVEFPTCNRCSCLKIASVGRGNIEGSCEDCGRNGEVACSRSSGALIMTGFVYCSASDWSASDGKREVGD